MNIFILGAGALGCLLGARLGMTGEHVVLLGRSRALAETFLASGLVVEELDGTLSRHFIPYYCDKKAVPRRADLVIVLVKSYDTVEALSGIGDLCHPDTIFLTLQNGMGNWERIAGVVGKESVLVGTTAQGSTLVSPGRVRHGGNGPTCIGEVGGEASERVGSIVEVFRRAGLETHASDRMEMLIWEKLMANVGINAITALTGIRNGLVAEVEHARGVCTEAVLEAAAVARAKGVPLPDSVVERVLSIARATAVNRSSMGQDVDRRKRTEVDAINGAIARFGDEAGVPVPVNRTLTRLIKTLETCYSENP